jgi:AbrB family looped-hinge helix DNA binding protein
MLRRITRNKQVTIPKEFLGRLNLKEGDYVSIEFDDDSIRLRAVDIQEFSRKDYEKLAFKLDQLRKERGTRHKDSASARKHLKNLMK